MISNEVDAITLQYFMNRNKFEKPITNIDGENPNCILSKERKFYRKRIIQMAKDLFKQDAPNDSIKSAHDAFILNCISYFKFLDTNDTIQEEYDGLDIQNTQSVLGEKHDNIDELLFNTPEEVNTLDNFVTKKIDMNKCKKILPKAKKVNLADPKLKNKGVKNKDKNKDKNKN